MEKDFEIGKIVNTQGIKGDIRVLPWTDDPKRFELLDSVEVHLRNQTQTIAIERVWYHKNFVILKLVGVDDMTAAEKLKNGIIRIPAEKALPLAENEYYIRDLIGLSVFTEEGEELGMLADVLPTGANDVYIVKNGEGKDLLIPAIAQCIRQVDVAGQKMIVKLLEGLRSE